MNDTIIKEDKLLELKDLARKIEPINKRLTQLNTNIQFGDRSDTTAFNLRIESDKLTQLTEQLTDLIKTLP